MAKKEIDPTGRFEIQRLVRWFEKEPGEALVGEAELQGITLPELQALFGVPPTDPMYDCWPVRQEHVSRLSPYLSVSIKLDLFDYFVEADGIEIAAT